MIRASQRSRSSNRDRASGGRVAEKLCGSRSLSIGKSQTAHASILCCACWLCHMLARSRAHISCGSVPYFGLSQQRSFDFRYAFLRTPILGYRHSNLRLRSFWLSGESPPSAASFKTASCHRAKMSFISLTPPSPQGMFSRLNSSLRANWTSWGIP